MEPDVVRMYSSSPPPMDDGAEEEDDEFGDFGGFSGVPPSASLTEFETPAPFGQSQSAAADTSPPSLINNGLSQGPFHRGSPKEDLASPDIVAHGGHGCPPSKAVGAEDWGKLPPLTQASPRLSFSEPGTDCGRTAVEAQGCNGGALTNGLGPSNAQESPAQPQMTALAAVLTLNCSPSGAADDFADFSAFCDAAVGVSGPGDCSDDSAEWSPGPGEPRANGCTRPSNTAAGLRNGDVGGGLEGRAARQDTERDVGQDTERDVGQDTERDVGQGERRDEERGMREPVLHNGQAGSEDSGGRELFTDPGDESVSQTVGLAGAAANQSGSSVTAGRAPPPEDPEDYGDFNTAEIDASPSSPGQGGTSSPAGGVEQAEDGEFGDAGSVSCQGFADSGQNEQGRNGATEALGRTAEFTAEPAGEGADEEDFGDFNAPGGAQEEGSEVQFDDFPGSDSFADFSSAPIGSGPDPDTGWGAFGAEAEVQELSPKEGDSWTAFGQEQRTAPLQASEECFTLPPAGSPQHSRKESQSASLTSRLVQLFQTSFPETPVLEAGDEILSLSVLLEPPERRREEPSEAAQGGTRDVWQQLQDVHNAFGLKHQWGGSHGNKTLLCSLGIDTRNILFTGQKKQPVIVPMYAASLGMLEPTKEPVKPISAAEKIASIAQAPPVSPEMNISPPDPAQEALPPVQFDWSSSGLTNPLDASGGSSLLNLDFFGPVEDSGSSSTTTSIPGVDPELYELTTAKLDPSSTSSRLSDAFALLMSTVEKTSTSTRKPKKEEHLSEEAVKVMEGLPDLSFMHAKVLMFPATLTPLGLSAATPD